MGENKYSNFFGGNYSNSYGAQPTAAEIAAELAKINPTLVTTPAPNTSYVKNPFTEMQLNGQQQRVASLGWQNPNYRQYLAKISGYGNQEKSAAIANGLAGYNGGRTAYNPTVNNGMGGKSVPAGSLLGKSGSGGK